MEKEKKNSNSGDIKVTTGIMGGPMYTNNLPNSIITPVVFQCLGKTTKTHGPRKEKKKDEGNNAIRLMIRQHRAFD